jgi:hypothetical protein
MGWFGGGTLVPIHEAGLRDAKSAQEALARGGVTAELRRPTGCGSGG